MVNVKNGNLSFW